MDFELGEDLRAIRDTVSAFTQRELMPLEPAVVRNEAARGMEDGPLVDPDVEAHLHRQARAIGLYGIDVPERYGGQALGNLAKCVVIEALKHSIVPFTLAPDSPNLFLLDKLCRGPQIERYLVPYANGTKRSSLALSEAVAGSDASGIATRADRVAGGWVLNGTKMWISHARQADFFIVIAVTDSAKRAKGGMTAFLVDRDAEHLSIPASYPMIGEYHPYQVHLDGVFVPDDQVLGNVGDAFVPLQQRLGVRRMEIAARSCGLAARCIAMMIEHAKLRRTFGAPLADRQAVQWSIADSFQELEMARLVTYRLAAMLDRGVTDFRTQAALAKVQATEMIQRVVDRAIQLHGAMGVSKELPLEYIARMVRVYRIVEGPSEVHRWTIARDLLRNGLPQPN